MRHGAADANATEFLRAKIPFFRTNRNLGSKAGTHAMSWVGYAAAEFAPVVACAHKAAILVLRPTAVTSGAPLWRRPPTHYLPTRFRALALFSRRSPERVVRSSLPAAENLHITGLMRCNIKLTIDPFEDARESQRDRSSLRLR